jgi:simple sugar transport system substrate-binding protein
MFKKIIYGCLLLFVVSCSKSNVDGQIAVFVPGLLSGSPIYQMLVDGVKKAAAEDESVNVVVIEAGRNQAEWESKLTALAASKKYGLIVSSNPSIPVIAASVSAKFPKQKFLILDGELSGNPSIYTLRYNQSEQAYMAGYFAALLSSKGHIGLVAAQNYPVMDNIILGGFVNGAKAVNPDSNIDFRISGSWSDAEKGAEIALAMIADGVDVILTISGDANEGVVQAAAEKNAKVIWFDSNGYAIRPGVIAGCSILRQTEASYAKTKEFLNGTLPFGTAELVGIKDGYIDFADDDPIYLETISQSVREKQGEMLKKLRSGELQL